MTKTHYSGTVYAQRLNSSGLNTSSYRSIDDHQDIDRNGTISMKGIRIVPKKKNTQPASTGFKDRNITETSSGRSQPIKAADLNWEENTLVKFCWRGEVRYAVRIDKAKETLEVIGKVTQAPGLFKNLPFSSEVPPMEWFEEQQDGEVGVIYDVARDSVFVIDSDAKRTAAYYFQKNGHCNTCEYVVIGKMAPEWKMEANRWAIRNVPHCEGYKSAIDGKAVAAESGQKEREAAAEIKTVEGVELCQSYDGQVPEFYMVRHTAEDGGKLEIFGRVWGSHHFHYFPKEGGSYVAGEFRVAIHKESYTAHLLMNEEEAGAFLAMHQKDIGDYICYSLKKLPEGELDRVAGWFGGYQRFAGSTLVRMPELVE